jgi:hypothetical protein
VSSVKQNGEGGQLDAGQEVSGELIITRGDATKVFEFIEEALDQIAFAIEREISRGVFRLALGGMTGVMSRPLRVSMNESASYALSPSKACGSTFSINGSAQARSCT